MFIETLLKHFDLSLNHRILDFGCGAGALVQHLRSQGYDAYGCDIAGSDISDFTEQQITAGYLRAIAENHYRLPFDNDEFDFVVSEQVLKHVMDYASVFDEIHRVLKDGERGLHIFPARYVPIEPHVHVPLGTLVRSPAWLHLWAALGIRNRFQTGRPAQEVARINHDYLIHHTNYPSNREILRQAGRFSTAAFREDLFVLATAGSQPHPNLKRRLISQAPVRAAFAWWSRTFSERLLFLEK